MNMVVKKSYSIASDMVIHATFLSSNIDKTLLAVQLTVTKCVNSVFKHINILVNVHPQILSHIHPMLLFHLSEVHHYINNNYMQR